MKTNLPLILGIGALLCFVSATASAQCAPPWSATTTYASKGTLVSENNTNFMNNWWTMGEDPATHNGGPGTGMPWTSQGPCHVTPDFTIAVTPGSQSIAVGANTSYTVSIKPVNGFIGGVALTVSGLPAGATGTLSPATVSGGSGSSTLSVTTTKSVASGSFTLQVSGTSAPLSHSATASLFIGGVVSTTNFIYAAYKDVTISANFNTGLQQSAVTGTLQPVTSVMPNKTLVWAFATGSCDAESWAGIPIAQEAGNVQAFVAAGKNYILGTGGAAGTFQCSSGQGLINFINRYNSSNLVGVDFDIEGGQSLQSVDALISATMQAEQRFPNLQFSFTIPSFGSPSANPITGGGIGTTVVSEIKRLGLGGNYVINLMTFDYGSTNPSFCVVVGSLCDMAQSAIAAATALHNQAGIPFNHIGLTQDIGQADTFDEVTSLANIDTINAFVKANGLATSRFWSFDRDAPGGGATGSGTGAAALSYNREFMKSLGVQ